MESCYFNQTSSSLSVGALLHVSTPSGSDACGVGFIARLLAGSSRNVRASRQNDMEHSLKGNYLL